MDNLSHTLAGMLAAEVALSARAARRAPSPALLPRVAWVTSAVANNLPDADFLATGLTGGKLGYLLHHRGHTHTLALAVPLAALTLAVPWLWARRRGVRFGRGDWALLAGLAALGPLLHLAFDSMNNYGVHLFWPARNGWLYGDTLFILEPFFWVCSLPALLLAMRSRWARTVWALPLVGMLAACWLLPAVPALLAAALTLLAALLLWTGRSAAPLLRAGTAVALGLAALGAFALGSRQARAEVAAAARSDFPDWTLHDAVLTPLPANPLCWEALTVMTRGAEDYALRRARVAAWPGAWEAARCPVLSLGEPTTAPLAPIASTWTNAGLAWQDAYLAPLPHLRALAREDCVAQGFLRFARAPYLAELDDGARVLGDLRYDREAGLGFAELRLPPGPRPCPRLVPPWTPPRADVLW